MTRSYKLPLLLAAVVLFTIAAFGLNPLTSYRNTAGLLMDEYSDFETGTRRQPNGVYRVRALTRMPNVHPDMVRWWFADYMQTTEHYKRWHPTAHVWMDWENKVPGRIIGASHLVTEYIGDELSKLRIQFVEPELFLGPNATVDDRFSICARVSRIGEPMNISTMCHIVQRRDFGSEMRSVFWLGHVSKREGNKEVPSFLGLVGNTWLARQFLVTDQLAVDLQTHAIQEMGYLSDFLPELYAEHHPHKDDAPTRTNS